MKCEFTEKLLLYPKFLGMYSIYFIQNHILNKYNSKIYIAVLTNGTAQVSGRNTIHYNKGTIIGSIRSLSYEVSNIKSLILDVGFDNNFDYLSQFILNPDSYINEPYYSKSLCQLWKEVYTPIYFDEFSRSNIQDGDLIIITGGLGGLGLVIAKEISTKHKVNFVMLSKSGVASNPNPKYGKFQLDSLHFIKANGCEVEIKLCDVSNAKQINDLLTEIKSRFGKIDGVIHAASSKILLIQERNLANMQDHIKSKIEGSVNLLEFFKDKKLKFFAFTSSMDSLVGGIGVFEYCAANSFLDILSSLNYPNLNLISINWSNWENIGMNIKFDDPNTKRLFMLAESEGAKIFYNLINQNCGLSRVAVAKINISRLKASNFHKVSSVEDKNLVTDQLGYLDEGDNTELENKIAKSFCTILGKTKLSKAKSFFSLGGNSLTAIRLLSMLNISINSSISIAEFYANDKVETLAKFIESKRNNISGYINEGQI